MSCLAEYDAQTRTFSCSLQARLSLYPTYWCSSFYDEAFMLFDATSKVTQF